MNEEQLEANTARLVEFLECQHRNDGWRYGAVHESRRDRIKRVRRWSMLPKCYPDRFIKDGFKVVRRCVLSRVELFVTSTQRPSMDFAVIKQFTKYGSNPADWPQVEQFNGYCRFKRKPVYERGYDGILNYVPVHGGITFALHQFGVSTYGFDTAHAGDDENPLCKNIEWVEHQALVMAESVRIAALYERDYLKFNDRYARAEVIDRYHRHVRRAIGQPFELMNNFGAMINAITGKI